MSVAVADSSDASERMSAEMSGMREELGKYGRTIETVVPEQEELNKDFEKLVATLRGDGAIKAAIEMAAAVKEVGGVTQLTEADLQRVNGILETAMEHYRATGQVAPDALHRVYVATGDLLRQTKDLIDNGIKPLPALLQSTNFEFDALGVVIPRVERKMEDLQETTGGFLDFFKEGFSGLNDIFMAAFEGGGQLLGAVKSFATQIIGNMMDAIVPGLGAFAGALVSAAGKLWSGIKSLFGFGGPSEAQIFARELFDGFHAGAVASLGGTQRFAEEVQRAINDGWDRTLAETRAGFILWGTQAGLTYDQAFADYEEYQLARERGDTATMERIEADYARYREVSSETTQAVVADADDIADRFAHMSAEEVMELREALRAIKPVAVDTFRGIASSSQRAGTALQRFLIRILAVNAAIAAMPRDITIRTRMVSVPNVPGRQHGGPVSAGRPYLVGEAGPEVFMPSSSGSVASNKSLPTAEEIGAAVAAAMQRAPIVVPQDQVTGANYRNGPRWAAWHGYA